jgi:hypothetical protein
VTEGRPPRRGSTLIRALAVFAVLLAGAAAALWGTSTGRRDQLRQRYEAAVEVSRSRSWARPAETPGWEPSAVEAAAAYTVAWDQATAMTWSDEARTSLDRTRIALAPAVVRASYEARMPLARPGDEPIPEPCLALGVQPDSDDLVVAQLGGELCEQLAAARPALEQLAEGSRASHGGSPLNLWSSPDRATDEAVRPGAPLQQLVRLLLLDGRLALARGDADGYLDSIFVALRFGVDLSRGAGMAGALVGMAVTDRASRDLEYLLAADVLTPAQARRAYEELAYVNAQSMLVGEAVVDELLVVSAPWFGRGEVPSPVPLVEVETWSLVDRVVIGLACGELAWAWDELTEAQTRAYPDRSRDYLRVQQQLQDSSNPVASSWAQLDFAGLDARITAARSRLQLLQVATADAVVRMEGGIPATDHGQLAATVPHLPEIDALSGEPFRMEHDQGVRTLSSAALEEPARSRLGVLAISDLIRPDSYLRVTLVGGESLQNQ